MCHLQAELEDLGQYREITCKFSKVIFLHLFLGEYQHIFIT